MKDVFRRGSSLKVYTSAAVSKKCYKKRVYKKPVLSCLES